MKFTKQIGPRFLAVTFLATTALARAQDEIDTVIVEQEWKERALEWGATGAKALLIFIIGWLIAWVVSKLVEKALDKTRLSNRLATIFPGVAPNEDYKVERGAGRITFWFLMLFVIMMVFQALNLSNVAGPIGGFLVEVTAFLPKLLAAIGLAVVAWFFATGIRIVIRRALDATSIDEKLAAKTEGDPTLPSVPLSKTLSEVAYWLVILLFVPLILGVLELNGLLSPVQDMFNGIFQYLPNILGAVIVFFVGWFIAKMLRRIVTGLLASAGADRLGERVGIRQGAGRKSLSEVAGLIVFTLIALVTLVVALDTLNIESISGPATMMLDQILGAIPKIITAAIILGVAWFIGKLLADLVENLLEGMGFDNLFSVLGFRGAERIGEEVADPNSPVTAGAVARFRPSAIAGKLVLAATMFLAAIQAFDAMDLESLKAIAAELLEGLFRVVLALVIFALGLAAANYVARIIRSSGRENADLLAKLAKFAILIIVGAMALREMQLGEVITTTAFSVIIISLGVAFAIAFGLGGRQAAAEAIEKMRDKARSQNN